MRTSILAALLLTWATMLSANATDAGVRKTTNIPAQELRPALNALARERDLHVVYRSEVVGSLHTDGAVGELTADEALRKLLSGTGLTFRYLSDKTVTIVPVSTSSAAVGGISSHAVELRLAQGDAAVDKPVESPDAGDPAGEGAAQASAADKGVPELLVKGSRSLNTDIQRSEDDIQPYVVFSREQIERTMALNVEDFLKTRLPMNTVQGTNSQNASSASGNQSSVDLRGLGANQTLILVDGRRMPSISTLGTFLQPDLNGLPLSSIERIEVLPATASGIYGGGATGGVINIITRKDHAGAELGVTFGNTFDTDASNRRFELSAGLSLEDGRTHLMVAASHAESSQFLTSDRDFVARSRALQMRNNPGAFLGTAVPNGYTTNIRSQNGLLLVLDNGTAFTTNHTSVPVGYAGTADGGMALLANDGIYNLDLPDTVAGARRNLLSDPIITSATASVRREFGSRVEAYMDMSWMQNKARSFAAPIPRTATLAAGNPRNPFDSNILVSYPATDLVRSSRSDSETVRAGAGFIVRLPRNWMAAADHQWSRSRSRSVLTDPVVGDPDGFLGPMPSFNNGVSSGALDLIRDLNMLPLDYTPYLLPTDSFVIGPSDTILQDTTVRLSGPVFDLPAGRAMLSAFVQRRTESAEANFLEMFDAFFLGAPSFTYTPERTQRVDSLYLEARLPVVSAGGPRLLRSLELQASVRNDDYRTRQSDPGSVAELPAREVPPGPVDYLSNEISAARYTLGLSVYPLEGVMLRTSIGTGFLPPSISEITPLAPFSFAPGYVDPKRDFTEGSIAHTFGGNPDLNPEDSDTWSVGVVFVPPWMEDLRLSADYTRIDKTDEIASLNGQDVLLFEDFLPAGRVTRGELTPEDIANGFEAGPVQAIDVSAVNIAEAQVEAWDFQMDYVWRSDRAGELHFYAIATWQPHFRRRPVPEAPALDSAGFNNGPLEWRGNAGIDWGKGQWTLGWNAQFFDSYRIYAAGSSQGAIDAAILNQGNASVSSQTYHDVFARYRLSNSSFASGWLDNVEFSLSIQNLFDRIPPILAGTGSSNGYSTYGDPRLRRYVISVRRRF